MRRTLMLLCILLAASIGSAQAKTLRWSTQGDPQTIDPYSQNEQLTNNLNGQICEKLVDRDRQLNIVPFLAVSWQQVNGQTWRFKLRPNVKFHDGTPFTADDVVFSIERAKHPNSQSRQYANALGTAVKIDELTDLAAVETNPGKRKTLVTDALLAHKNEFNNLPLHRQIIPWAARSNVKVVHRADNWVEAAWANLG